MCFIFDKMFYTININFHLVPNGDSSLVRYFKKSQHTVYCVFAQKVHDQISMNVKMRIISLKHRESFNVSVKLFFSGNQYLQEPHLSASALSHVHLTSTRYCYFQQVKRQSQTQQLHVSLLTYQFKFNVFDISMLFSSVRRFIMMTVLVLKEKLSLK